MAKKDLENLEYIPIEKRLPDVGPFTQGLWRSITTPIVLPRTVRKLVDGEYNNLLKKEKRRYLIGAVTGGLADATIITGFSLEAPEVLLGLAATNVASGLYELGRWGIPKLGKKFSNSFYVSL